MYRNEEDRLTPDVAPLVIQCICAGVSVITVTVLTASLNKWLAATNPLEVTPRGRLGCAESTLLNVIDNCMESVAVLSLDELTFRRGSKSTSLYFGDCYMNAKVVDLIHEDDRHVFLDCVAKLRERDDAARESSACQAANDMHQWQELEQSPRGVDEESPLLLAPRPSAASKNNNSIIIEFRVFDSGGKMLWLESTVLLHKETVNHNVITTLILLTRDITAKKSESDLLQREHAAKLKYITCCAHDLKTPLQSFSSALDLLLASGLSVDQRDVWNQAEISLSLMNLTIAQTMDTSKVLMVSKLLRC